MAVSSVAICVEGVLQKHVSSAPIAVGIALYHGLASTFNVLLITESDKKTLDYWLALEALNKHAAVEYNDDVRQFMTETERKIHQINALKIRKYNVDLVIDPNPASAALLLSKGFNVLVAAHSAYALPQWRPDYTERVKPWEEFEKYVTDMATLRFIDDRLKEDKETD